MIDEHISHNVKDVRRKLSHSFCITGLCYFSRVAVCPDITYDAPTIYAIFFARLASFEIIHTTIIADTNRIKTLVFLIDFVSFRKIVYS